MLKVHVKLCKVMYTPSSPVSVKKHTVNKKLTICLMDKTV